MTPGPAEVTGGCLPDRTAAPLRVRFVALARCRWSSSSSLLDERMMMSGASVSPGHGDRRSVARAAEATAPAAVPRASDAAVDAVDAGATGADAVDVPLAVTCASCSRNAADELADSRLGAAFFLRGMVPDQPSQPDTTARRRSACRVPLALVSMKCVRRITDLRCCRVAEHSRLFGCCEAAATAWHGQNQATSQAACEWPDTSVCVDSVFTRH